MICRERYGVTLVMGPFNGLLTLLFDPAVNVLAAGNPCILKLSDQIPKTSHLPQNDRRAWNVQEQCYGQR